jgi:hypothetical protein
MRLKARMGCDRCNFLVIPAQGVAGNSAWSQAARETVRTCKSERALQAGIHLARRFADALWIPACAGMTVNSVIGKGKSLGSIRLQNRHCEE